MANLLQGLGLIALFYVTSRDIDRTIKANQEPVSADQTKALAEYVDRSKPRGPGL